MSGKYGKRYTPKFKFKIVMEVIGSSKAMGQIARDYGLHPITINRWKKELEEKGPEIFGKKTNTHEYEKKIRDLERLIGHKEVEIAILKNFLTGDSEERKKSI